MLIFDYVKVLLMDDLDFKAIAVDDISLLKGTGWLLSTIFHWGFYLFLLDLLVKIKLQSQT